MLRKQFVTSLNVQQGLIHIDSITIASFKPNSTLIELAKSVGISIPRFCYHELLSIAGNCRMCLIEIEPLEKPAAACSTEVRSGMRIFSNSLVARKSRESVLEAILVNHPLDCPICDQAGECDLQEQTRLYASGHSRYYQEPKKTSDDEYCNPLIKTIMTRCITCTRCVRFATEIAGSDYFGTLNRGRITKIGSYEKMAFFSEISGNVVDLCPVGALNSGPQSYRGRPWEIRTIETIDLSDAFCQGIYIDIKLLKPYRILPKSNEFLKASLLSDVGRYSYEHLSLNRLTRIQSSQTFIKKWQKITNSELREYVTIYVTGLVSLEILYFFRVLSFKKAAFIKIRNLTENTIVVNYYVAQPKNVYQSIDFLKGSLITFALNFQTEAPILGTFLRTKLGQSENDFKKFGLNSSSNNAPRLICLSLEQLSQKRISLLKSKESVWLYGESYLDRTTQIFTFYHYIQELNANNVTLLIPTFANYVGLKLFDIEPALIKKRFLPQILAKNLNSRTLNVFFNVEDNVYSRIYLQNIVTFFQLKIFLVLNSKMIKVKPIVTNVQQIENVIFSTSKNSLFIRFNAINVPTISYYELSHTYLNLENKAKKQQRVPTMLKKVWDIAKIQLFLNQPIINSYTENAVYKYMQDVDEVPSKTGQKELVLGSTLTFHGLKGQAKLFLCAYKDKIRNTYDRNMFSKNSPIIQECSVLYKNNYCIYL